MVACLRRRTSGAAGGVCAQRIARVAHYDGGMELRVNGALIHYVEHGRGVPLVALHGAGVDHREIEAALEAIVPGPGYRRIYPDLPGMGRIFAGWRVDVGSGPCLAPALIVAGRCDSIVGYSDATELLEGYPHATLAVLDGAGHALMHERPEPLAALVRDWLDRTRSEDR